MKKVIVTPLPGTVYKYALGARFETLRKADRKRYLEFLKDIGTCTGKSRMTLWRWRNIKHTDHEDIPFAKLEIIALLLTLYGVDTSVNQLKNYVVEVPLAVTV